jgi:UDP-N-acetylglucosamine:LPS N-acetylglucosamine transferase
LLAGGGTAGHIIPGLAVAAALVERGHAPESLVFVGSERGLETDLVPEAGYPLIALPGRGIQRRFTWANVEAAIGIVRGVVKGIGLVRRTRPKVVVVVGGYASVACTVGAILWRVPIVVTEQNARAGAANRLAGRFAKAAAVPFPETDLRRKVVAGNPVRPEILEIDRARDRDSRAKPRAAERPHGHRGFSGSLGSRPSMTRCGSCCRSGVTGVTW